MARKRQPQADGALSPLIDEGEEKGKTQGDLFGAPEPYRYKPDLTKVRARLHHILRQVRKWEAPPPSWTGTFSMMEMVFPKIAGHLPEDEGAELLAAFNIEAARLREAAIKRNFPPEIEWGRIEIDLSPWRDDDED